MRVKHCFAPNCPSNTENEPSLTFHSLPSNQRVLQQWAKNMDREERILNAPKSTQKHYFICGKHFVDSCFQTYERKKLNRGAVPTIFNITKDKKPVPNLKITNIFKSASTKPIILNHQIVFPNAFENIEDNTQLMLPKFNQIPVKIDLVEDSDLTDQTKISVDLPELTKVRSRSDEVKISTKKLQKYPTTPEICVGPITEDLSSKSQDAVVRLPSNTDDGSKGISKKPSVKFKDRNEHIKIKPLRRHIRHLLMKANKLISLLKKCEGNCMKLFNNHVTIFNCKVIRNLEKLDNMPNVIKIYMNHQVKYFNKSKSVKYKKHEIPFYTALYKSNKTAYQFLLKIFNLPSTRKLHIFLKNTKFESGLNSVLIDELRENSMLLNPLDKYCTLLFKDIRLCPYLSYNSEEDETEGLQINRSKKTCHVVNHCFIFFLSGLHTTWKQPVAYYFVSNQTKSLHNCITEVISEIHEKTNYSVIASVSTMNTVNINAIQCLMAVDSNEFVYKVNGHEIIHIFDPPSLLQMLRNHFIDHDIVFNQNRRAKWRCLAELYNLEEQDTTVKLTKLTSAHINPNKYQKSKVILAAQIFSCTVSKCLKRLSVNENLATADFCRFVNNLFDSFNSTLIPKCKENILIKRLNDSSGHFEFWNEAETILSSLQFHNNKTGKIYTSNFGQAFIININNTKKLWNKLKNVGFEYLLTKHLNLDPLENFHAVMRYLYGKYSKYPTYLQIQESFKIALFNDNLSNPYSNREKDSAIINCSLKPEIFRNNKSCLKSYSNTRSFLIYKMVKNVHLYSAENISNFLIKNVLSCECHICIKNICKDNVRMVAFDNFIEQIYILQRNVYKNITEYINQKPFIKLLYGFAEEIWKFDFNCPKHKFEMKYKTIICICFIMVKCFIEITNKLLWKQSRK